MKLSDNAVGAIVLLAVVSLFLLVAGAFWWSGQVPSRPKTVSPDAVFLWAPNIGVPGPRRGSWLSCKAEAGHNTCKLSDIDGGAQFEGDFVSFPDRGLVPAEQLEIDPKKTTKNNVWVDDKLVPIVVLKNGRILAPAIKYQDAERMLTPWEPDPTN
jgi:hypothetical protein